MKCRWIAFASTAHEDKLTMADVPWPPSDHGSRSSMPVFHSFLLHTLSSRSVYLSLEGRFAAGIIAALASLSTDSEKPGAASQAAAFRDAYHQAQLRWHPDKFHRQFGDRLEQTEADQIHSRVLLISQQVNAEWSEYTKKDSTDNQ